VEDAAAFRLESCFRPIELARRLVAGLVDAAEHRLLVQELGP
jgi:hypothetical protein